MKILENDIDNMELIEALIFAIEIRDAYTQGHSKRVAQYATSLASWLGMDNIFIKNIYVAGMLHDLGKIGIPDEILLKPGKLNTIEYNLIKLHSSLSEKIIYKLKLFKDLLPAVRHHHESYDGSGYPDNLKGDAIPLMSRIISIVDVFDALTTKRVYRDSMSFEKAISIMEDELKAGKFDPIIYKTFKKNILDLGILNSEHLYKFSYPELEYRRNFFHFKNPKTNLLNKDALVNYLKKISDRNLALFFAEINVKDFSEYNRIYGLSKGDELLAKIALFLVKKLNGSIEFEEPQPYKNYIFHGYADKFYILQIGYKNFYIQKLIQNTIKEFSNLAPLYYKAILKGQKIPQNFDNSIGYRL